MSGETVEVYWLTDTLVQGDTPVNADNVKWPQTLATGDECGDGWFQVDTYPVEEVPALIEDGVLMYGEDFDVVISWRFVKQEPCPVVVTPPPSEEPVPVPTPPPTEEVPVPPTDEPHLADTGVDPLSAFLVATALVAAGVYTARKVT